MLSRLFSLRRRQAISSSFLSEQLIYVREVLWPCNLVSERGISTARSESGSTRTNAEFCIYKGKALLQMSPVPPTFTKTAVGYTKIDRKGSVMLKFIPAIGLRKYDYEKKQIFALSASEVGCLISLGPTESCEFLHDPSMKSSLEGQVKKTLAISPLSDGGGYMFNISVTNSVLKTNERVILPVSRAEFSVMRTACGFALPHILGWDRLLGAGTEHSVEKVDIDSEWER